MSDTNKRLIPLHNLSIDNLQKVLNKGSFMCPSVAYTIEENWNANQNYGEVAVIFSDDVLNPDKNKNAVLLSCDGYTGTVGYGDISEMNDEEIIQEFKNAFYGDQEEFMYQLGASFCKASAAKPISMETAMSEIDRIVPYSDYYEYKDKFEEQYEAFLDKTFPDWWDWGYNGKGLKHVFETPFLRENSIAPNVETGVRAAVKAYSQHDTPEKQMKAMKAACMKYGLRATPAKLNKIAEFAEVCRKSSIVYFEDKVFQTVPFKDVIGIALPSNTPKEIFMKLEEHNVPFAIYSRTAANEERQKVILGIAKNELETIPEYARSVSAFLNEFGNQLMQTDRDLLFDYIATKEGYDMNKELDLELSDFKLEKDRWDNTTVTGTIIINGRCNDFEFHKDNWEQPIYFDKSGPDYIELNIRRKDISEYLTEEIEREQEKNIDRGRDR